MLGKNLQWTDTSDASNRSKKQTTTHSVEMWGDQNVDGSSQVCLTVKEAAHLPTRQTQHSRFLCNIDAQGMGRWRSDEYTSVQKSSLDAGVNLLDRCAL